jgi:hypothetical protein
MDAAEALPPLPLGWRDEAVSMLFEFLEDAGLASTLDALEKETGCVSSSEMSATPAPRDPRASSVTDSSAAVAEDETPRFRRRRRLFADPSRFPSTFPAPTRARRRGGSAATLCDALAHLRRLVLDGRWAAAEAFAAPEDDASSHPSVDRDAVRARLRTQAFLELMDDQSAVPAAAPDPDALVKALGHIREVCGEDEEENADEDVRRATGTFGHPDEEEPPMRLQSQKLPTPTFRDACAVLALGDVRAHPPLRAWTRARGRLATFEALARELAPLYPEEAARKMDPEEVARFRNAGAGALELALRRAVAHASHASHGAQGRSTASLRSALGLERGGDDSTIRSKADDPFDDPSRDAETRVVSDPRRKEATKRQNDDDDDDGSPRFAFLGDVVEADAGVRCLTRFPRERADGGAGGIGAFAAATSARVLHVVADAGANLTNCSVRHGSRDGTASVRSCVASSHLDDAHVGSCSIYALAWTAADADGGGVVATGANDGGLALTETRLVDEKKNDDDDDSRVSCHIGRSLMCERRAVRGGAVRAVAFVGSAAGSADDDFVDARDARFVIAAGEGDFAPRAWHLDESGLGIAGPGFALGTHAGSVVAAAADPETRWLLFTASAKGEAFLWDLRESRASSSLSENANESFSQTVKPSLRCDVAGACGFGAAVTAATVRGGRFAFGFSNGGVAAADARRGRNSVAYGNGGGFEPSNGASSVVWSDVVHAGRECRSVDIAPSGDSSPRCARLAFDSPFLILSGGFDGRLALADAATAGRVAWRSRAGASHADKVTAARFDARGRGFASCGVDRVVKAWALRDEPDDARDA